MPWFDQFPICPGCHGARELTGAGVCHTCERLGRRFEPTPEPKTTTKASRSPHQKSLFKKDK